MGKKQRQIISIVLSVGLILGVTGMASAIASEPMQLSSCKPAFEDKFQKLDISPSGPGTRWIAHTPWAGDFGDATFANPDGPDSPFSTGPDGLTITASKDAKGHWQSGLLSSTDPRSQGFAATYGYFEMVANFPPGKGTWPAFWLLTADRNADPDIEIDVIEYLGLHLDRFQATVTVRPKGGRPARSDWKFVEVPSGSLVSRPHAYGVSVGHKDIVFYLDRLEIWRTPTPPEHTKPLGVLLDLALGSGYPINETPNPSKMIVNRVAYYPNLEACGMSPADVGD